MKFPAFSYRAPSTIDDALRELSAGSDAKLLAGGQSLLPLLALRLAQPSVLVDLGNVADLSHVSNGSGRVTIGAGTTLAAIEDSSLVAESLPLLARAVRHVAHRPIRNRATVGGSLAHADPAAELPAVALALDATMTVRGVDGERRVPAAEFFAGPFVTALRETDILTGIEFPVASGSWAFLEVARRPGDYALAMVAVGLQREGDTCTGARVVVQAVGSKPVRAAGAEKALTGAHVDHAAARAAADALADEIQPVADIHGSSDYRRRVAATLVRRAVLQAAGEGGSND